MYRKILIIILIIFSLNCFHAEEVLFSQKTPLIDIKLNGIWSVRDETKNISRLLYLRHDLTCATLCLELNISNNKAMIHCYKDNKVYEVKLVKIGNNEYEFQNKRRKLKFKIEKFIYKNNIDYYLIFYKENGKIQPSHSGECFCLNETNEYLLCAEDDVSICKKRAQEFDEEASHEKELEYPL